MEKPETFAAYADKRRRRAKLRRNLIWAAVIIVGTFLVFELFGLLILRRMLQYAAS